MIRSSWMLGAVFLVACSVESAPVAPAAAPAGAAVVSSALVQPASRAAVSGSTQAAVCTPGETRFCCPYPQGCTCPGDQFCEDDGQWDECYGPSPRPGPCL